MVHHQRTPFRPQRRGLTLIEVLIVVAVIGLLLAMLLPAVQMVRETSRRSTCAANIRQINTAVHMYEERHSRVPNNFRLPIRGNLKLPMDAPLKTVSPIEVCPSDSWVGDARAAVAGRNYYINGGRGWAHSDGVFGVRLRFRDVTDGLSNTALCAEQLLPPSPSNNDYYSDPQIVAQRAFSKTELRLDSELRLDLVQFADECIHRKLGPLPAFIGHVEYNHIVPPNHGNCVPGDEFSLQAAITASSLHPHGVNLGLCDGAVRFISNDIDRAIWSALGTRAGGESLRAF